MKKRESFKTRFLKFLGRMAWHFGIPPEMIEGDNKKKSKKTEAEIDLARFIFDADAEGKPTEFSGEYENGCVFYLLLSAGSVNNIKPDTVMEAFYAYLGKEYNPYAYQIHRLETYADLSLRKVSQAEIARRMKEGSMPERKLVPLMEYHKK